jgi:hypothetical protein
VEDRGVGGALRIVILLPAAVVEIAPLLALGFAEEVFEHVGV